MTIPLSLPQLHDWPTTVEDAVRLQLALAPRVEVSRDGCELDSLRTLAGCDIAYDTLSAKIFIAVVVLDLATLQVVEQTSVTAETMFPYVPGLLSFREIPPLLLAFAQLRSLPDGVMVDAQGIAHPRRFGLACHLGLWLNRPTLGVAKSWLVGEYVEPGPNPGDSAPLVVNGEVVGSAFRSAANAKVVYVSPGHLMTVDTANQVVRRTLSGYRHPTPTRLAHILGNEQRANLNGV